MKLFKNIYEILVYHKNRKGCFLPECPTTIEIVKSMFNSKRARETEMRLREYLNKPSGIFNSVEWR